MPHLPHAGAGPDGCSSAELLWPQCNTDGFLGAVAGALEQEACKMHCRSDHALLGRKR